MLFKNVIRTLRKKWMQLAAIGIIIILSSLIYTMMFYGLSGIEEPTRDYLIRYEQEDFSVEILDMATEKESLKYPSVISLFSKGIYSLSDIKKNDSSTFYELMNNRIKAFEDIYRDYSLELREYKNITYDYKEKSHKGLIIKDSEKINKSFIEEGTKPSAYNEIAVNRIYAMKNSIKIGDFIKLDDKQYKVTGFVLFPDYTLPMFDNSFNVDTGLQTLMLLTDSEYESISGKEAFRFSGINLKVKSIDTAFNKNDLPFVTQIVKTGGSMRSGAIYSELNEGKTMGLGLSIFIALIAVIIVSILIYNMLRSERGQIGILKALGYRRVEIAFPYFFSIISVALVMLVIGYILGSIYSESLKKLYLDFYLLPSVKIGQNIIVFVTAIFVPFIFFAAVSGTIIYKMLGDNALELLKPHENKSINRLSRFVSKILVNAKGKTKFKYLYAIRNPGSFLMVSVGIMFSTILIFFSFMMSGMVDRLTVDYLNKVNYKYEAYVDFTKGTPVTKKDEEKFISYPYAYLGDKVVSLTGLSSTNSLYNLYDDSGNNITSYIRNGAVITKMLSIKFNIDEGDTVRLKINKDYYNFTVKGITDEYLGDKVYLNINNLSNILTDNRSSKLFTGIYSLTKPASSNYSVIISKDGVIEQSKAMANYTQFMINIMIGGSAIIAISILFILTSFTVENSYYVISLLKVMGYNRREVNSMILSSYFTYTLISYLISIPIAVGILKMVMDIFAGEYGIVLPLEMKPSDMAKGMVILVVIFLAGTYTSRKKIKKISLQEVLKTYSE